MSWQESKWGEELNEFTMCTKSHAHYFVARVNQQRWRGDQTSGKRWWHVSLVSVYFGKKNVIGALNTSWCDLLISFSTDSCFKGALECADIDRWLVFAWSEAGARRLRTRHDLQKLPWRQWALQARNAKSMGSKCQTSHMECSSWCSLSDGRT